MIQSFDPGLTWRVVWLQLLAAGLSLLGETSSLIHRPVSWSVMLTGMMVGIAGFQVAHARTVFGSLAPNEVRWWMRPVAFGLYALGGALCVLGIRALVLVGAVG